ncbi:MAG: glycosyltransferase [Gammaproteobacteria bacterium]|nr:glycosyltransferase [Gammaproteobacteria bacterium]
MTSPSRSRDYPDSPDLEVLICTHDRADLLARTLSSLDRCTRPAGSRIGIFVVANACSDRTTAWLGDRIRARESGTEPDGTSLPLRWIEDPVPGKSHALNLALPLAHGRAIAFVDDDHRVDAGYLAAIHAAAARVPEADFFCGRILPDWDGTEPAWTHDSGPYRIYPLPVPRFDLGDESKFVAPGSATPGGGNLAIRQGLFERIGPFRLELGPHGHDLGGAEDIEWVRRGVAAGAHLYYEPTMLQYHYVDNTRLTLRYLMQKAYERSASTARLGHGSDSPWPVPLFTVRKSLTYAVQALCSLSQQRRRFYLTRLAAALGEVKGFSQRRRAAERTEHSLDSNHADR